MTPEDAWRDNRAAVEIQCHEARADERRRIIAYLRSLGGWGAVAAAAIEGDDYWKRERAEAVRSRSNAERYRSRAPDATVRASTPTGDAR